ncbi:MAG TPA: hypothetical protein V6D27_16635 [Vampirovibrionales bacterium]
MQSFHNRGKRVERGNPGEAIGLSVDIDSVSSLAIQPAIASRFNMIVC